MPFAVGLVVWSFQLECDRADCSGLAEAVRDQFPLGLAVGLVVAGIVSFVIPRLRVALRTAGRGGVLEGPSGIGKTTAVTRALDEIGMSGSAQILSARAPGNVEYIAELPHIAGFGVVVVDDFHVLPVDVKNALADHLKRATCRPRERRDLTGLADVLDELVPA